MPPKFAHGLRTFCVAVAFVLATAHAAEPKEAPSPIGLTRDQVITRYGEPRSQIVAGNRLIMFFPRERIVLRDGVVIEVERLAIAAPAPAPGTATPPVAPATDAPAAGASPPAERTGAAGAVQPASTPAAQPAGTPIEAIDPNAPPPAAAPTRPAADSKLEIKSVRRPDTNYRRPPATKQAAAPSTRDSTAAPAAPATSQSNVAAPVKSAAPTPAAETKSSVAVATPAPSAGTTARPTPAATAATILELPDPAKADENAKATLAADEKKAKDQKLSSVRARRRIEEAGDPDDPDFKEAFYTTRTFVITVFVVAGGLAYLLWSARQRQLLLAATAVSHSPFGGVAETRRDRGATLTPDLLSKLEWKRFEELVADYYAKTGVVAARTKTGPASPVHIKISWKGEPRPFAYVQCIAHPVGLVEVKPLQDLVAVLATDDIRRGYVITAGKFSVPARDFAEEKHLTLLPGDIFLEKLNALPETARAEIINSITTGDYETPSCPKCEAKMVKSPENPSQWRCAIHAEQVIPGWR